MPTVMSLRVIPSVRTRPSRVLPASKIWTGVAEWEEPRHSGRLLDGTVPHFLPLSNTISHSSVRRTPIGAPSRSARANAAGSGGPPVAFPAIPVAPVGASAATQAGLAPLEQAEGNPDGPGGPSPEG